MFKTCSLALTFSLGLTFKILKTKFYTKFLNVFLKEIVCGTSVNIAFTKDARKKEKWNIALVQFKITIQCELKLSNNRNTKQ